MQLSIYLVRPPTTVWLIFHIYKSLYSNWITTVADLFSISHQTKHHLNVECNLNAYQVEEYEKMLFLFLGSLRYYSLKCTLKETMISNSALTQTESLRIHIYYALVFIWKTPLKCWVYNLNAYQLEEYEKFCGSK